MEEVAETWHTCLGHYPLQKLCKDHQDLAPEDETHNVSEIHSFVSSEDMSFQILIEQVLKLLRADKFPIKTDEVLGGNRLRSSIVMEC